MKNSMVMILYIVLLSVGTSLRTSAATGLPPIMETTPCPAGSMLAYSWTVYEDNNQDGVYDWHLGAKCDGLYFTGKWPPDDSPVENVGTLHVPFFSHVFTTEQHPVSGLYRWRISMKNVQGAEVAWAATDWEGNFSFGENLSLSLAPSLDTEVLVTSSNEELGRVLTEAREQGKSVKVRVDESKAGEHVKNDSSVFNSGTCSQVSSTSSDADVLVVESNEDLTRVLTEAREQGRSVKVRVVESNANKAPPSIQEKKTSNVE